MSDLIERQATIDTLKEKRNSAKEWYEEASASGDEMMLSRAESAMITFVECILTIKKLPSAQPEIVRCGQCKYAEVADTQDNQDGYTCQFHRGSIWFSGSYCSWGERRTDG